MRAVTVNRMVIGLLIALVIGWSAYTPPIASAAWDKRTEGVWEYWSRDGVDRFRYNTDRGQWWHCSSFGSPLWHTISATGLSDRFIGDGGWYNLGNGFTYRYYELHDDGYFKEGDAYRFRYRYGSGQWYDSVEERGWQALGADGQTAAFIGTGTWVPAISTGTTRDWGTSSSTRPMISGSRTPPGRGSASGTAAASPGRPRCARRVPQTRPASFRARTSI